MDKGIPVKEFTLPNGISLIVAPSAVGPVFDAQKRDHEGSHLGEPQPQAAWCFTIGMPCGSLIDCRWDDKEWLNNVRDNILLWAQARMTGATHYCPKQ